MNHVKVISETENVVAFPKAQASLDLQKEAK